MFFKNAIYLSLFCFLPRLLFAETENFKNKIEWGGFIDSYYAYDFNEPNSLDRAYTTQPARHNEFNVNLAYLDAQVKDSEYRGRLALQAGTSVQSNYSSEPTRGLVSGSTLSRHIQEAFGGVRLSEKMWLDAGIYFSHIGAESFISKDNFTYTRSLVADFSPFYQTGIRMSYEISEPLSVQLHVVNGWQNISENNGAKSVGTQIAYVVSDKTSLIYNTLVGREREFRHFHDFIVKQKFSEAFQICFQSDVGFQKKGEGSGYDPWYGFSLIPRYSATSRLSLVGRLERYSDTHQIIVSTGTPNGFKVWGASLGTDLQLNSKVVWRTELRGLWSKDPIYPKKNGFHSNDWMTVTSFGVSL